MNSKEGILNHIRSVKRQCIVIALCVVCFIGFFFLILLPIIMEETLGNLRGEMKPTYIFVDISQDDAIKDLAHELDKRWGIQIKDEWEVLFACTEAGSNTASYLVRSSTDFDYEGFRVSIMKGGSHRDGIKGKVYEEEYNVVGWKSLNSERRKEHRLPHWWKPEELQSPKYVEILYPKEGRSGALFWFFVFSKEDHLMYIFQNKKW